MRERFAALILFLAIFLLISAAAYANEIDFINEADVLAFTSPETSFSAIDNFISNERIFIYVATYTITSKDIVSLLDNAPQKGKNVKIVVEGKPVGGIPEDEKAALCYLSKRNISIKIFKGATRTFLHAKFMVGSNSVLISTENFGDSSFPATETKAKEYNRGWGVVIKNYDIAQKFADFFSNVYSNADDFECDENYIYTLPPEKTGKYNGRMFANQGVLPIFGPNMTSSVIELIKAAKRSLYIEQLYIETKWTDSTDLSANPLLAAVFEAARKNVDVKILLDSSYYNIKGNGETANLINELAEKENLSISAKLADLKKLGLQALHVKGVVADNTTAFISSMNWAYNSAEKNYEAGVIVDGKAASYFSEAFLRDWEGTRFKNEDSGNDFLTSAGITIFLIVGLSIVLIRRKTFKSLE